MIFFDSEIDTPRPLVFVKVVFTGIFIVDPIAPAFILDELKGFNRLVNRAILRIFIFNFKLANNHGLMGILDLTL